MKKRFFSFSIVVILGIICLIIGFVARKNAMTDGPLMDHNNHASFKSGDKVTLGYDFIAGSKELDKGLHFGVLMDDDLNTYECFAIKSFSPEAGKMLYNDEGVEYYEFSARIYDLSEEEKEIIFPIANKYSSILLEHNPGASIAVEDELKASLKHGIRIYPQNAAKPFMIAGAVLLGASGVILLFMLLRLKFSASTSALIISALIPIAIAGLWIRYEDDLGKFTFARLYEAVRLLIIAYSFTEKPYRFMLLLLLLSIVVLMILHHLLKKKQVKLWMGLCLLPMIVSAVYICGNYVIGNDDCTNQRHIVFGVIAVLILIWGIIAGLTGHYKLTTAYLWGIVFIALTFNGIYIYKNSYKIYIGNYTHDDWETGFVKMLDDLSENYISRDWKEIDFEELKAQYLPKVQMAQRSGDKAGMLVALFELRYELADGHVWAGAKDYTVYTEAQDRLAGNDYGFAMFKDEEGRFLAVMVDEDSEAYGYGITDGTVISKWDGIAVSEAAAGIKCIYNRSFAYLESEELFKPVFLAGRGGDTVSVTFLDDNGAEHTVSLDKMGSYRERLDEAIDRIYSEKETQEAENYETRMLNEHIGYMRFTESQYEKESTAAMVADTVDGYSERLYNDLDQKLEDLKSQGMDCLIIDLRGNDGGVQMFTRSVIGLFTDKEQPGGIGRYKDGEYHSYFKPAVYGRGDWKDLPLVCMINGETASCGDIAAHGLQRECGAVLTGMATTWGSAQAVGGTIYLTDGDFRLGYPTILAPDFDGLPIVDGRADRKARFLPDVKLEFNREEIIELFKEDGADVELEKVIDYIETR